MNNPKQEAIETIQVMVDHAQKGDFDAARALFSGEVETIPIPKPGENETLTFRSPGKTRP